MCIGSFIWQLSTKGLEHILFFKLTNISKSPFSVHTKWKTNIFRTVFGWIKSTRPPNHSSTIKPFPLLFFWITFCITVDFFPSPVTLKLPLLGGKKQILDLSFDNCTMGQVETMICFHCCLTRYPVRRGLVGREGNGWGLRIAEPLFRTLSGLTTGTEMQGPHSGHLEAKMSLPVHRLNGTVSSEADFVENHSGKMNLTLFFPISHFPPFLSAAKGISVVLTNSSLTLKSTKRAALLMHDAFQILSHALHKICKQVSEQF